MTFNEAEDFEIVSTSGHVYGRYMVNSQEPYEVDIEKELKKDNWVPFDTIQRLLDEGIIIEYRPNYTVTLSLFDEVKIEQNKS